MKSREIFEEIRSQKDQIFGLRMRLTLFVAAELIVCILISFGAEMLLKNVLTSEWRLPLAIAGLVLGLIICFGITGAISNWFFDPIKQLSKAMERVADGDFSVRLQTKSRLKEIREVYSGFNMMTHELGSIEIIQGDFVSNVSHEFKTPINAVEGYAMLLQDCDNLDDEEKKYVDGIIVSTQRLSTLIGSILLLSKIENRSIPTDQTEFSLDEQIRCSIVGMENMWERKEIEIDADLESIRYYGNERLMIHVWDNLLSNAIKFSPPGDTIIIRLKNEIEKIVFTVEDHGDGISEEAKKHIFEKFYQADSSHKQEGNGLGLALVSRILMLEDGEIFAENIEGGCRFTVKLKRKRA